MSSLFSTVPLPLMAVVLALLCGVLSFIGTRRAFHDLELPSGRWPVVTAFLTAVIAGVFVWTSEAFRWQSTPEVIPAGGWREARIFYHLALIVLLSIVTATDFKSFYILDWCCWLGLVIGLTGAGISGDFQLAHVWVDWNQEIPQLRGPAIPAWLASYPHLHGIAWSVAGAVCGFVLTELIRRIAAFVLQTPALGFGDVLLMGMVGSFLGWQPTIVALILAPLCAVVFGGFSRVVLNYPALPYGPFLAAGSLLTLFFWKFIWMAELSLNLASQANASQTFALRRFFGDAVSLGIVFGLSTVLFIALLGLLRLYRQIPGKSN